ncbi:MAG TPA: hypothetical protein VEX60_00235 [Pyrinomonadaceae bacterium]|nr:hypothetical protein [Pyrinomonadaceae bacterium]
MSNNRTPRTRRTLVLSLVVALSALLFASAAQMQTAKKPISRDGLVKAVKINGLPTAELVQQIQSRGVAFQMTPEIEQELKSVGGQPEIIEAARANYRPPVSTSTSSGTRPSSQPSGPRPGQPVPAGAALSKNEIITMLQAGTPSSRVEQFVEARGVTFALDAATTNEIKSAGGDRSLIGAITEKGTTHVASNSGGGGGPAANSGPDYDDYIDKVQSFVSYGDWNSAINVAQQAIRLDPQQPAAYSYLGQGLLYGRGDFAGADQAMRLALERGGSAAFRIYHDHDGSFNNYCVGSFFVTRNGVSFRADDGADTFQADDSNIKEAKINGWVGVKFGAFHIKPIQKIIGRDNFNFAPGSRNRGESQLIINLIQGYR